MTDEWENLCRRCGQCCFEKKYDEYGQIVTTRVACRHLDIVTRECRVYHKRFDVGENCVKLTPAVVAEADWLPACCAYREMIGTRDAGTRKP